MDLYWLEQSAQDMPHHNRWLGPQELKQLQGLIFLKRRMDWRLGRWTAKCAIAAQRQFPLDSQLLANIEICASPSGAPDAFISGRPANMIISLSHRDGIALCTLSSVPLRLGCDVELVEPRSMAFVEDYFTFEERDFVSRSPRRDHDCLITLLWSAKESALKAMREGLRLDTCSVVVRPDLRQPKGWTSLQAYRRSGEIFYGWWREESGILRTVVADVCSNQPIELHSPAAARLSA
jgi:4'-phosphopantetheinyl transferase